MTIQAIILMVIGCGIVWGGLAVNVAIAFVKDGR